MSNRILWISYRAGLPPPPKFQPHTEARVPTEVRIKSPVILPICDQSDQRYEVDSTVQDSIQAHTEPRVYDIWTHGESPQFATTEQTTTTTQEVIFTHLHRLEIFPSQQMSVTQQFQAGQGQIALHIPYDLVSQRLLLLQRSSKQPH